MEQTKFKAIVAKTKLGWTGRVKVYDNNHYIFTSSTHVYRLSRLDVLKDIETLISSYYGNYQIAI